MVRNYVRKTARGAGGNWSMDNMRLAIVAVKAKSCSKNKAAVDFGVPEPTLRRYLAKEQQNINSQSAMVDFVRFLMTKWRKLWPTIYWN